jgi:membrane protein
MAMGSDKKEQGKSIKSMHWMKRIPKKLRLLWFALRKFNDDKGFLLSSGLAFTFLVGLIPLLLLLLFLVGTYLYSDREVLNHIRRYLENVAPSLDPRVMKNILRVIRDRKIVGVLGVGGLIWASIWVFSTLRTVLNIIFQVKKGQGIIRGIVTDLLMIFLVGTLHLSSMTLASVMVYLKRYRFSFKSPLALGVLVGFALKYIIPFLLSFWMFFLVYKIIPNKKITSRTALQAALFTSLLWEGAKHLFGWYVLSLGGFTMVYGSLSTLAIFVLWVFYSSTILLMGGEVAYFLEKERAGR